MLALGALRDVQQKVADRRVQLLTAQLSDAERAMGRMTVSQLVQRGLQLMQESTEQSLAEAHDEDEARAKMQRELEKARVPLQLAVWAARMSPQAKAARTNKETALLERMQEGQHRLIALLVGAALRTSVAERERVPKRVRAEVAKWRAKPEPQALLAALRSQGLQPVYADYIEGVAARKRKRKRGSLSWTVLVRDEYNNRGRVAERLLDVIEAVLLELSHGAAAPALARSVELACLLSCVPDSGLALALALCEGDEAQLLHWARAHLAALAAPGEFADGALNRLLLDFGLVGDEPSPAAASPGPPSPGPPSPGPTPAAAPECPWSPDPTPCAAPASEAGYVATPPRQAAAAPVSRELSPLGRLCEQMEAERASAGSGYDDGLSDVEDFAARGLRPEEERVLRQMCQ
jgi:hypothetical protein